MLHFYTCVPVSHFLYKRESTSHKKPSHADFYKVWDEREGAGENYWDEILGS